MNSRPLALLAVTPVVILAAGCGGSGKKASSSPGSTQTTTPAATTTQQSTTTSASGGPGALQAEARSAATGDIPDNQKYLVFHSSARWTMKYPEGWAQSGSPTATVFRDKNNIARVVVQPGTLPALAKVRSDPALHGAQIRSGPTAISIGGKRAIKVAYSTKSAANPVTGKRVTLLVDRYFLAQGGKVATIDLGTPVGVDNHDAYRLMIQSFRWK